MYVFIFSQSEKVCKIPKACGSFQHQGVTRFYGMLKPIGSGCFSLKKIYFGYEPFIMKMHADSPKNDIANKNLSVLCDV